MRIFNKFSAIVLVFALLFGLNGQSSTALAATTPSLGAAATFGILANTFTRNIGVTAITGDLGYTTLSGSGSSTVTGGTTHVADATYTQAGIDQGTALTNLNGQACTFTFAPGAIDLATDTTHGAIGIYTPGVYCTGVASAASIGTAGIALSGAGTYIFRINGALTTVANSHVTLANGASSCDVFWTPTAATTIGANNAFAGTVIDNSGITVGSTTSWIGRALNFATTVTTDTTTISSACATAPSAPAGGGGIGLTVQVPPLINVTKIPTPLALPGGPGPVTYNYTVTNPGTVAMNNITVTDNQCVPVGFISGDINNNAMLDINESWNYSCTRTLPQTTSNTVLTMGQANGFTAVDTANATVVVGLATVPPLIHLTKIPSAAIIPYGGAVTYTYRVTNPGVVALSNVIVTDDRCSPISGHSGDVNGNNMLDISETWVYSCQTNLTATTVNTGAAQGSANGLIAIDYALATVAVNPPGLPVTGYAPESTLWKIVVPAGLLIVLASLYLARRKQII